MRKAACANDVAAYILQYLLDNPEAEDTLDGIVEWWVMRQKIQHETTRVKEALSELVNEGFILERLTTGAQVRYQLNTRKLRAIRAYLKDTGRKEKS